MALKVNGYTGDYAVSRKGQSVSNLPQRSSIDKALSAVGVTDEKLAAVLDGGLDATELRSITVVDGDDEYREEVREPDWHARHKFLTTALTLKGHLKNDEGVQQGGLIIIAPSVQVVEGHAPTCQCSECIDLWNRNSRGFLEAQQRRRDALERELADMGPRPALKVAPSEVIAGADGVDELENGEVGEE